MLQMSVMRDHTVRAVSPDKIAREPNHKKPTKKIHYIEVSLQSNEQSMTKDRKYNLLPLLVVDRTLL